MDTTKDSYKLDSSMEEKANPNNNMQDHEDEEEYDEETLSFCDLPIYGAEWGKEDQSLASSSSSSDQDFFEFFSEDWSNSSAYPVDNIVFCGKLIPSKEPNSDTELKHRLEKSKPRKRGLFRWNSKLFNRLRSSKSTNPKRRRCVSRSSKSQSLPVSENKYGYYKVAKGGEKYGYSVRRVSILALPAKPRWYLLMFGLARTPAEMELSDIRRRKRRRSRSTLSGGAEKVSRGKWLWWLIRALGCGGQYHYRTTTMQTPP